MAASWYRTGTLTLTNGSAEVSGAGTAFLANVRNGDMLIGPVMDMYEIAEVVSDSKIKLARPYAGAGYTGDSWEIAPTTAQLKQLAQQIADLVAIYQDIPEAATAVLGAVARVEAAEQSAKDSAASANAAAALAVSAKTDAAESAATATGAATTAITARDGASASQGAAEAAAQQSISAAATANQTAEEVRGIAQEAKDSATHAVQVAEGIDGKATQALAASQDATTKAESAQTVASASDSKAQLAQSASANAVTKADAAVTEAASAVSLATRVATAVGSVDWWPLRSSIPAGRIPADGQTISRATFPDLADMVAAGTLPVVSEADWQADPLKRGSYTLGDGSTTIRVPDLNGKSVGAVGAVFLRGDGALSPGVNGLMQMDAMQPIVGVQNMTYGSTTGPGSGPFSGTRQGDGAIRSSPPYSVTTVQSDNIRFDSSFVTRTASETRPKNASGVWTIQAFGAVTNPGSVDAAQLASDYAAINAAIQTLRGQVLGIGQVLRPRTTTLLAWYQNTTGRPILVGNMFRATAAGTMIIAGYLNSVGSTAGQVPHGYMTIPGAAATHGNSITMTVPPGLWWMVDAVNATIQSSWEYS